MIDEEDSDSEKEVDTPKNIFATSPNVPRLERVRHKLRNLEKQRDDYLIEKRVIGQVSSRHRDIVSELANIPNKRVPFKWQRGIKIGEKFVMLCQTLKNNLRSPAKWLRHSSKSSYNLGYIPCFQQNCIESCRFPPPPFQC